jgi:hypothetical protein
MASDEPCNCDQSLKLLTILRELLEADDAMPWDRDCAEPVEVKTWRAAVMAAKEAVDGQ